VDDVQFVMSPANDEEETEAMATLWMSCSPGRDSDHDGEEEEEEEEGEGEGDGEDDGEDDEDDCVPLSQLQISKGQKTSSLKKKPKKDKRKTHEAKEEGSKCTEKVNVGLFSVFP
jgi:cobalamin biosynthesis protein CobT